MGKCKCSDECEYWKGIAQGCSLSLSEYLEHIEHDVELPCFEDEEEE